MDYSSDRIPRFTNIGNETGTRATTLFFKK